MTQDSTKQHIGRLQEVIKDQKCMLMVGYGLSSLVHPEKGHDGPSNWSDVLRRIANWCSTKELFIDNGEETNIHRWVKEKNYANAQACINSRLSSPLLRKRCLTDILLCHKAQVSEAHRIIARLPFRAYITTNYDTFIENAFLIEQGRGIDTLYDREIKEARKYIMQGQQFVLKLCGDINYPDSINLIDIGLEIRLKAPNHPLTDLRNLLSMYHFLFVGFQRDNPDLACLENLCKEGIFDDSVDHWLLVPQEQKLDFVKMSEQNKNIHIVTYLSDEGLEGFLKQWEHPSSKRRAYEEESRQKESVLETVANGEHPQNRTIHGPPQQSTQENEGRYVASLDKTKGSSISYVNFTLQIGSGGSIKSRSPEEGERPASIEIAVPENIQLMARLIEADAADEALLQDFGIKLYQMIFPPDTDKHFNSTEAAAKSQKSNIRIQLNIEPDTLAVLPWEFLYRKEGGYFLAVNPDTVLARYLDLPLPPDLFSKREGPLDLLIIIANPTDQTPLDPEEWEGIILQALKVPCEQGLITVRTVKQATFEQIRDALFQHNPDMIQFVGHGIYHNGRGYLALVDSKTNKTWKIDDSSFANIFLGVGDTLRLLTLATCESAKSDSPRGFLGIAPQIVQRGVPIVVAMRYSIPVDVAEIYLEDFYTAVAAGRPVDWAVQHARNAISIKKGLNNREFATPVLYMRAPDGNIF